MSAGVAHWRDGESAGGSHGDGENTSVTEIGGEVLVQASALEIERGEVLAGRYQIEAVLGRGGSGIVLRAFDRVARVAVAVKILKPELATDPRWIERFSRELRLARQIQHPHVCRVFDIGQADGHWFITMELATGGTLRKQLAPGAAPRSSAERLADVRAVVDGLAAIHEAGIVHRDVKPDNFLRMDDGRLVLSDFGLATNPADAPAVSILVGTPHYMAPEVVMGEIATLRSDVWAAGVVVHEILCGERPPRSLPGRRTRTPVSATVTRSPVLEACAAALAEDPEARPASAVVLRGLVDEAIMSPSRFSARTTRRGRATAVWGGVAVAIFGLVALFASRLWQPVQASSASSSAFAAVGEIRSVGTARDWSLGAKVVTTFDERVHCFDVLPGGEKARAISGSPRRAEDIDLSTGVRAPSMLRADAFQFDCPQVSPRGDAILFTQLLAGASPQIVLAQPDGTNARPITNGTEPQWLPSGDEFLFDVADTHVGVFSLPTMKYTLLADDRGQAKQFVYKKAISPHGDLLAAAFLGEGANRILEIHSLPDLNLVAKWQLPNSVRGFSFYEDNLVLADASGDTLDKLDWRTGLSTRLGYLKSQAITSVFPLPGKERLLVSVKRASDVWMFKAKEAPRQVTTDGGNYAASSSPSGEILVEKMLSDGRLVIFLYDRQGHARQVTNGHFDAVPAFIQDGSKWTYADYDRKAIVLCAHDQCADVLRRDNIMEWPVMAPDQKRIAFVTAFGVPRIRVVDAHGQHEVDLGPTAIECPPIWTSASSLWAFSGAGTSRRWEEVDVSTGHRTGKTKDATTFDADEQRCGWESEPATSPFYRQVRVVARERWQVARTGPLLGLD